MANKKIDYTPLAKELKKHIEIIESTFAANNLQVISLGCKPYEENDADLRVNIEIATISGSEIPSDLQIKINLYDEDDDLYMTNYIVMNKDKFSGYDTITINCYDNSHVLEKAVKGRLFVTRR